MKIDGRTIIGRVVTVDAAFEYFSGCGGNVEPDYTIEWFRDGKPVQPDPIRAGGGYDLDIEDLGGRISAVVKGSTVNCVAETIVTEESGEVRKEPMRAEGFTGRGVFELEARRPDGVLMSYLGHDNAQGWKSVLRIGSGWESFTRIIAPGDFTADGLNDILVTDSSGALVQYEGYGDGAFTTHYRNVIGGGWNAMDKVLGPGDFDGNGLNDLLASDANGDLYLYPRADRSSWGPRVKVGQGWGGMDLLFAPGDFNGDGNVDVMAKDKDGRLFLYGGNGRGGWTTMRQIGQGWNALSRIGSAGDFNRDGFSDVHGVNSAGDLLMYYGDGRGGWKGVETVGRGWGGFNGLY